MAPRRRYTKREKLAAVLAADMSGITEAAKATGIPKQTIDYWMDDPAFGRIRTKTREDLADEIKVVAHLAWHRIAEALRAGTMEPRDALFAAEKATGLRLLMAGEATERTETRDITDGLDDHEKQALNDAIRGELARRSDASAAVDAVGAAGKAGTESPAG